MIIAHGQRTCCADERCVTAWYRTCCRRAKQHLVAVDSEGGHKPAARPRGEQHRRPVLRRKQHRENVTSVELACCVECANAACSSCRDTECSDRRHCRRRARELTEVRSCDSTLPFHRACETAIPTVLRASLADASSACSSATSCRVPRASYCWLNCFRCSGHTYCAIEWRRRTVR